MKSARSPFLSLLAMTVAVAACGSGGSSGDGGMAPSPPAPPPPATLTLGGTVTGLAGTGLVLQSHSGEMLPITGNGAFTFQAPVQTGVPYQVVVRVQPTSEPAQRCSVTNGSGTVGSAPVTNVSVQCGAQVNRFIYVPNSGSGDISAFAIHPTTGALSPIAGSPYPAGVTPRNATANRNGTALFVSNEGSASTPPRIAAFAIHPNTGALAPAAGSPFDLSVPPPPAALTPLGRPMVHPSGSLLYLTVPGSGSLYGATVDATSGSLSGVNGMPLDVGTGLSTGAFNFAGDVLYLPHDNHDAGAAGGVSAYSVNSSGVLTRIGSFATGGRVPATAVLNSQGTLLFAPNAGSGTLAVFRVEASGTLTAAPGSPFNGGEDTAPVSVALHPSKNFVYATNFFVFSTPSLSSISAFRLDPATGVLTPVPGSPFPTGGASAMPARIHPTGKFLYVSNRFSNNIQAFVIDQATGALTLVPGSPFATGLAPSATEIDASGRFLFVASSDSNDVSAYAIDGSTGALTLIHTVPAGTTPSMIELVGLTPL